MNNMRLIDADALLFTTLTDGGYWTKDVVYKQDINEAPTIDAVPVIRCQNCKCRTEETYYGGNYLCKRKVIGIVRPTDFCSFGEPRGERK